MGSLVFFPTDRFGAVTRNTEQPHPVERLAAWLRKAAHIRASATMGCDATIEAAPNIIPLARHYTKGEAMARSIRDYCAMRGYSRPIQNDAIRVGIMRISEGRSVASAIASAKVRADFAHQHVGNGPRQIDRGEQIAVIGNGPEAA